MTAVFISYSRADQDFVRRLHAALDGLGRDAWVDWQGIAPTAEWMAEIRRAIDAADATLFVLSPAWVHSRICGDELAHAVQQGKRLVPVVWRDCPSGSMPDALARLNWVMLRQGDDFDQGLRQLVAGLDTDLAWVRDHTRLIVRAQQWQTGGHDDGALLRGRDLQDAERWLSQAAGHTDPAMVPLQAELITRSRQAATRRQRITLGAVVTALVVAIGLAIWAVIEQGNASRNAIAAEKSASVALFQEGVARQNEKRAVEQEGIAKAQTAVAEQEATAARLARDAEAAQRSAAESAQREAERQRDAALARQLAARAQAQAAADPALGQKAALLAMESLRVLPNIEADQVLRRVIARLPLRHAELPHRGVADSDVVQGAGSFVAFADARGLLRVVDTGRMREIARHDTGGRTRHVQVDPGGRWVVYSSARNGTMLFTTADGSVRPIADCDAVGAAFGGRTSALLALGCQRDVRLIDLAGAQQPVRVLGSGDAQQLALAFSRGSDRLAGVDSRGDVRVWDVADGQRIGRVPGQESDSSSWSVCCTAFIGFSASGLYIASSNLQGDRLHVIATDTWTTHAWLPHTSRVNVFAFDEQDDLLASGERNGRITVWNLKSKSVVAQMSHADEITQLRLYSGPSGSGNERQLLSASTDRTARVWNVLNGVELTRAAQPTPVIWIERPWQPNFGQRFVSLDSRTGLAQWDMKPLPPPLDLSRRNVPRALAQHCSAGGESGTKLHGWFADGGGVISWDAERGDTRHGIKDAPPNVRPVAIDPACRWMAFATAAGLRIVAPEGSWRQPVWQSPADVAADVATDVAAAMAAGVSADVPAHVPLARGRWELSPRGTVLLLHAEDGSSSRAWRTAPWLPLGWGAGCKAAGVLLSPDERRIAVRCGQDQLRAFDVASGRQTARLNVQGPLALTNSGQIVWRAGREMGVRQLPGGQVLGRLQLPEALRLAGLAPSPDGRSIVLVGAKLIRLWRLPTLTPLSTEDRSAASAPRVFTGTAQFSPDSRHLLVHGEDRFAVFDTEPWSLRSQMIQPGQLNLVQWDLAARRVTGQLRVDALERDAQFAAVAWSMDSGTELQRVPLLREAGALRITADQRFLLADQVHRWSSEELGNTACRLLSRNLTRREWQSELGNLPYRRTCAGLPEPPEGTPSWDQ